ncbi:DUF3265 domain-containing protein [Vibrio metschnikovii]|nr:DUF3265 domain-containing protein [Vibrio metschnikovii]MDA3140359.1 DUF3265 domain-containing protein [Vibrio metschnikovii]
MEKPTKKYCVLYFRKIITKRLRGTWHAWHFWFAVCLVVKVLCGNFCIACLRPLTRRYIF